MIKRSIVKAKAKNDKIRITKILFYFGCSRSSFYSDPQLMKERDTELFKIVSKHHQRSKGKAGIRQISMMIERAEGRIINHKAIARIKRKFKLDTEIRKVNKFRKFAKKKQEHEVAPNILARNFKPKAPRKVFSTDITQLNYRGRRAYLAAFKDLSSNEIVAKNVSHRIDLPLVITGLKRLMKKLPKEKRKGVIIHSDQGFHFTHIAYRSILKNNGIIQSMSRKGNCIDNAPIESFFGHFKDLMNLKECKNIQDVKREVTKQINYYNYRRPQLGLKKMPPVEYGRHLTS